eukprot:scaffold98989_cov28-Cyclotella_meneghiniana.AAC.1
MELEGSQNHVGRETESGVGSRKRDGIAVEGSWDLVGQWMGLTGDEKVLLQAVVVGVRENADFPLAQYLPNNSWTDCCIVVSVRENAEFPKKCILRMQRYPTTKKV